MTTSSTRVAFVSGARLPGWVERFAASHGGLTEEELDGGLQLSAADGAVALLQAPWPAGGRPGRGGDAVARLASLASQQRGIGAVLVRRGGYSVAVVSGGAVLASKTGTRHVQSRTAAGGWSSSALPGAGPTRPTHWWRPLLSMLPGYSRITGSSTWRPAATGRWPNRSSPSRC